MQAGAVYPHLSFRALAPDRCRKRADVQRLSAFAGHAGSGQGPDHVPPAHAAALGSVKPVQVSCDQLRELLPPSARKMEVLSLPMEQVNQGLLDGELGLLLLEHFARNRFCPSLLRVCHDFHTN